MSLTSLAFLQLSFLKTNTAGAFRAVVLKSERCYDISSVRFEKATLPRRFQCSFSKTNTATAFRALVLKNERCYGDSSASFQKLAFLWRFQCSF
jgi:hypothetical protein